MKTHWMWGVVLLAATSLHGQSVVDPALRVQTYVAGLNQPTGAVFLNNSGDALITQKNDGRVLLLRNKRIVSTVLDLPVANGSERGLLGIALSPDFANDQRVFLYHTAASADGGTPISNKVSRYIWNGSSLVFERKIIDLPVQPGPNHSGGKIAFDSKGKLLAVIGDLNVNQRTTNFENSTELTRTAAIIRVERNGHAIRTNPFSDGGTRTANDDILAYGIRNSFGLAVDSVTGWIWDTENGPDRFDEINRVMGGFNSGWEDIMGPRSRNGGSAGTLVSLGAKAAYADPQFSWASPVAPTDLHFLNSSRLGSKYRNDLFLGDVKTGALFHFDLTADRKSLVLTGDLADGVADNTNGLLDEQDSIIFGRNFGVVTDLLNGPGALFVLSLSEGKLFRISTNPASSQSLAAMSLTAVNVPEPSMLAAAIALIALRRPCTRAAHRGRACRSASISPGCRGLRRCPGRSCCG